MKLPAYTRTDVITDNLPLTNEPKIAFFIRSYFFNMYPKDKTVYVDYILQAKTSETDILGEWKCRVTYEIADEIQGITIPVGFEFYKDGFRFAEVMANAYVRSKYNLKHVLPNPTDAELLKEFQGILSNLS